MTQEVVETGLPITVTGVARVYCDHDHVVSYPATDEARQRHVTFVHAEPAHPTVLGGHDENEPRARHIMCARTGEPRCTGMLT